MPEPTARPAFRTLQRWGIPFHFVLPALTAALALALLWAGGVPAVLGGWVLVAALPIAIGAFISVPWFVLGPAAVWLIWVIIGKIAGPQALLAETPVPLAIGLSLIGAGATWVAQRAIFAATDPEVLHAARSRAAALGGEAEEPAGGAAAGSGAEAGADGGPGASASSGAEVDIDRELAELADGAAAKPRVVVPEPRPQLDPDLADEEAGDEDEAGGAFDDFDEDEDDYDYEGDGAVEDDELIDLDPEDLAEAEAEAEAESDEPAAEPSETEAEGRPRPGRRAEVPLGEDPSPLDEGGHVTEFQAISEELLAAEDSARD